VTSPWHIRASLGSACIALLAGIVVACGSATGYQAPQSPLEYTFLVLERDSLSLGVEGALAADGLRVRDQYRGGERAAAAVMLYPFDDRLDVRVVDTRSGRVLIELVVDPRDLPADSLGAGEVLGGIVVQAIRRPR
jgi:hypothetical protein